MHEPALSTPSPPRYRWLKRCVIASLIAVSLVVGMRLAWGARVQGRMDTAIANIQAKSEPILFAELQSDPVPESENGARYLLEALNNWPSVPGQLGVVIDDTDWYSEGEEAGFPDPITDNAAYLDTCQEVFDLLRQADACNKSDWGVPLTRPILNSILPHLGNTRRLARLLDDAGSRAMDLGDTEQVFEVMLLQHAIARHVPGREVVLLDSLVAISIMAINRDFIEKALPRIDPADLHEGPAREMAFQVIGRLTDTMLRDNYLRSFIGERAMAYDFYECLLDGTTTASNLIGYGDPIEWVIDTPGLSHAYRPALQNAQHQSVLFFNSAIEGLQTAKSYDDLAAITQEIEAQAYADPLINPMIGMLLPAYGAANRTLYRSEALLHCAAAAIAIKLYEADHDGQRPVSLDELVPDYLPAIPRDPFSPIGEPIRYNPAGIVPQVLDPYNQLTEEQRSQLALRPYPLLYSVGEDGQDHRGGPLYLHPEGDLSESERFPSPEQGEAGDIWFMLDAWPQKIFSEQDLDFEESEPYEFDDTF